MTEEWRDIPGYEGRYQVSDQGEIRVPAGASARFPEGRNMAQFSRNGYRRVSLTSGSGERHTHSVHRLVLRAFVGEPPPGTESCHWDGNRSNNRLENLRWDTAVSNSDDNRRLNRVQYSTRTHCPQGHPYSGENLYVRKDGARMCKRCNLDRGNAAAKILRRSGVISEGDGDWRHGRLVGYKKYGCRCEDCRMASAEYERNRRASS